MKPIKIVHSLRADIEDARPNTVITQDDIFGRLGILVADGKNESIDIVDAKGELIMRLNVFNHGDEVGQSIDVVFDPLNTRAFVVQSWDAGERTLYEKVYGSIVSISRALSV